MKRLLTVCYTLLLYMAALYAQGGSVEHVTHYDEEDGLPHGHVTQVLRDELGFIWLATWNGLCRYDGYEFRTFKSQVGDGCHMTTDRFRDIALRPDGCIVCRVDDDYYLFDTHTCRFRDLSPEEARQAPDDLRRYRQSRRQGKGFVCTDRQGNQWMTDAENGIRKLSTAEPLTERFNITPAAQVKCLFIDNEDRYWVTTREDAAVRIYSSDGDWLMGYLGADGQLHSNHTAFSFAVYTIYQMQDGTLWLGTKPGGLYRLREVSASEFRVEHVGGLPDDNIYNIVEDRYGRLWVATLGGGLCYTDKPYDAQPRFVVPKGYPKDMGQRVRFLHLTRDGEVLMAAATDGLIVARLEKNAENMRFHRHQRESDRAESLSSSATMDIMEDHAGRLYVSTESGGINRIEDDDLLALQLHFQHFTEASHQLPSDVVMSLTPMPDGGMMVVGGHLVSIIDSVGHARVLDARYFNDDYRFSDAHPLLLGNGQWLFGLKDGAFTTPASQMYRQAYQPTVVLTGISIQGGDDDWAVAYADTLTLRPGERSVTVRFAALDYSATDRINYAFRLLPNGQWNNIGRDRSATLLDLQPGTYQLELRATDADGQWLAGVRRLTLVVQPTFWESTTGRLLIVLLVVGIVAAIVYTLLYIRRIKRKQRETLAAYLALLEVRGKEQEVREVPASAPASDDPMLKRVMAFIEANISNSDASVGDMAEAAAVSRSGLQRKLKQTMGITPQDLLREARIKRACQLLRQTDKTVADVAYACGFTDPKYFSRCFKQSTGQSPTEYREGEP